MTDRTETQEQLTQRVHAELAAETATKATTNLRAALAKLGLDTKDPERCERLVTWLQTPGAERVRASIALVCTVDGVKTALAAAIKAGAIKGRS